MSPRYYTYKRNVPKPKPGWMVDFKRGAGYYLRPKKKAGRPPVPKPPPVPPKPPPALQSVFAGKGLFTTSNAGSASGHPCDWVAWQMDPEGDEGPVLNNNPALAAYWQARPSHTIIATAKERGIPYIAQAESTHEIATALALGADSWQIPHALVGNPTAWSPAQAAEAARQGWDLILEWYWQEQPAYITPDANNYPRFVNVCFGTYPAENPPVRGSRVSLAAYRAVWQGSFSCWPAEAMTPEDWAVFDAA